VSDQAVPDSSEPDGPEPDGPEPDSPDADELPGVDAPPTPTTPAGPAPRRSAGTVVAVVAVVAVVVAALVFILGRSSSDHEADTSGQVVGRPAPSLVATTTKGEKLDLGSLKGKWVLVNFFATWCPPCVAEHPQLVAFSQRNKDRAAVVSVAFDEPAPAIEQFFADKGGDWDVVAKDTGSIVLDYGVVKLPESYLIAPDGTVVEKLAGGVTADGLEKKIADYEAQGKGSG